MLSNFFERIKVQGCTEYCIFLRMKNWTSKGKFFSFFDTFYSKIHLFFQGCGMIFLVWGNDITGVGE